MRLLTLLVIATFSIAAHALKFVKVQYSCPVGGERFEKVRATSGFAIGTYLDLRPYGDTVVFEPLPVCPSNGFVIFRPQFSEADLKNLQEFVASAEYQDLRKEHTSYGLAAVLARRIGESQEKLAFMLLYASWEAGENLYRRYAQEALDIFDTLLSKPYPNKKDWLAHQLIAGELERRTGKFDASAKRFSDLKDSRPDDPYVEEVVELQLKLVAERNAGPQLAPFRDRRLRR